MSGSRNRLQLSGRARLFVSARSYPALRCLPRPGADPRAPRSFHPFLFALFCRSILFHEGISSLSSDPLNVSAAVGAGGGGGSGADILDVAGERMMLEIARLRAELERYKKARASPPREAESRARPLPRSPRPSPSR